MSDFCPILSGVFEVNLCSDSRTGGKPSRGYRGFLTIRIVEGSSRMFLQRDAPARIRDGMLTASGECTAGCLHGHAADLPRPVSSAAQMDRIYISGSSPEFVGSFQG